jgi:purine-binding chemotaxis protein CheW
MSDSIGAVSALLEATKASTDSLAGQYLTFRLADEEHGLEILKVREIIGLMPITKVPHTPEHVRGVLNLRGKIIPVVDLRLKFGLPSVEDTMHTCIIVLEVKVNERSMQMGVIVDQVLEVRHVPADAIEPPPSFGLAVDTRFILGLGKMGSSIVLLLDVDRVLSTGELAEIDEMAACA